MTNFEFGAVEKGGKAAECNGYRILGGHMVRLLLHVSPTANAIARSTADEDTAIGSLEIAAPMA